MRLEECARRLRKWTAAEKQRALDLYSEGLGPKAISAATGYPQDQIRFWLYGPRMKARRSAEPKPRSKNSAANSKRAYYRSKYTDWASWKAMTLRSTFIARLRKAGRSDECPSRAEIEEWLISCDLICCYCGVELLETTLGVDHATPLSRAGSAGTDNLRMCCRSCNMVKGSLNEGEYRALLALIAPWEDGGKSLSARLKRGFVGRS